jgi:hypothetical protein
MRSLLPIFLLSVCALHAHITPIEHREGVREIFQSMAKDPDYAMDKLRHCLHHTSDTATKITLLQERAFLYLVMRAPQEALRDLETIISMISYPSEDTEYALVKALWMHFAISARLHDATCVKKDLELLKKWDKNFPKVDIHHGTAYVIAHTNSSMNFYAFTEMLEGFGLRSTWDHKLITVNAGYYEAQVNDRADHHLVELAAACAFTDSPWGSAAGEYVGKTFAHEKHWKPTDFPKYIDVTYRDLLRNLRH